MKEDSGKYGFVWPSFFKLVLKTIFKLKDKKLFLKTSFKKYDQTYLYFKKNKTDENNFYLFFKNYSLFYFIFKN